MGMGIFRFFFLRALELRDAFWLFFSRGIPVAIEEGEEFQWKGVNVKDEVETVSGSRRIAAREQTMMEEAKI